jgi:hypothetical protein
MGKLSLCTQGNQGSGQPVMACLIPMKGEVAGKAAADCSTCCLHLCEHVFQHISDEHIHYMIQLSMASICQALGIITADI